jgi:hypothetical protein
MKESKMKRGKFSDEDLNFIKNNSDEKTVEEIAKYLDRNPKTVKRVMDGMNVVTTEMTLEEKDEVSLRKKLINKDYWQEIEKQFTENEIDYFISIWIQLIKQFREDVLPTEELQIKQLITTEILMNRCMVERKRSLEDIERLTDTINQEYAVTPEHRDTNMLLNLEQQLALARGTQTTHTNEYTKLSKEYKDVAKDLKATRDQRLKRIEDGKTSWIGLIRMLEDEQAREREGHEMEVLGFAADKAREALSEYHSYEDGKLDMPILTPDTVLDKDDI